MKILFVSPEGLPFSKTGGLADVVEALPKALAALGHDVAVVLPRYRGTRVSTVVVPSLTIPLGDTLRFPAVADGSILNGVRYFFVDDPEYFDRDGLYTVRGADYPDNGERFALFSKAAIEIAKQVWRPDLIHCHDWQTALVPVLLRSVYSADPLLRTLPVVFTVHNMGYHGTFDRGLLARAGLPASLFDISRLEFYGRVNLLKGGLLAADWITTVSRRYAQEIMTPEFGHGLDGVVRERAGRVAGILNGADYSLWNPQNDEFIAAKYSAKDLSGKAACKKDLLREFKLAEESASRPLLGIVSRFVDQKGFDLLAQAGSELLREDLTLAVLGTGDPKYERFLRALASRFPGKMGLRIGFDNALAHRIEAGADMFLMPSRYEPCGLNQIYSLRYATVPIVRATGGLDDTVEPFEPFSGKGTGFKFADYDGASLLVAVRTALEVFRDAKAWRRLQLNGMAKEFSWNASAAEYARLYETALKARIPRAPEASN
ncbi:MAG: glycogen synthase GlgA [Acidobacteria bacterium]|nr:glycogen synthase GlgA [Acidobacteriota bacterium]MBI3662457.1 glycogen synthase GlgA [Acidobacteriota bacterium]